MNSILLLIFILYVTSILSLQFIKIKNERYKYIIRKSVHLLTGLIIFFLTFHIDQRSMLLLICTGTVFSVITYNLKKFNFIHATSGTSLGTLFYPFGILLSFLILYNMPVSYFRIALMILSLSDTIANLCGEIKKLNMRFAIFKDTKSIFGVIGFAISAIIIHIVLLPEPVSRDYLYILLSVIAAIHFEIISVRGSDNFTIPVGCSLFFLFTHGSSLDSFYPVIIIPLTAAGSIILFKKNILTQYGSFAAYILGIYLFTIAGAAWSIPVVTFFITSVIFTKINGSVNHKTDDSNRRNVWQVCANIFFAAASSVGFLLTGNNIFIYFFISLIATVTADTWASEIGPVFSKKCFSLADFTFKESGISGGVSIPGTIAALLGSLIISVLSYYIFFNRIDPALIIIITLAGFAAMFVDSLLSAFLEPKLFNMTFFINKKNQDSPTPNDIVNLTASLAAPLFFLLFQIFIR